MNEGSIAQAVEAPIYEARILRELGPFPGASAIHGVTFDGQNIWACVGHALLALDATTGEVVRTLEVTGKAGTAFDGRHFYQLAGEHILKLDARTGEERGRIPSPGKGGDSGLTWAEGSLWVGHYRERKIYEIDPKTGRILRTIESDRFVTGVTFLNDALWHGTWEGDESELRRIDVETGEVRARIRMPEGVYVSGLESDGAGRFFCGGGPSGKLRVVATEGAAVSPQGTASK
jgi:glutamine cyclotransferase